MVVDFDECGLNEYWYDPDNHSDPGVISIDSKMDLLEQLYVLLHEAGHVILRRNHDFDKNFPDSGRHSLAGRVEILREEVHAWTQASILVDKFSIGYNKFFDEAKWRENYRNALAHYAEWVKEGDKKIIPRGENDE